MSNGIIELGHYFRSVVLTFTAFMTAVALAAWAGERALPADD